MATFDPDTLDGRDARMIARAVPWLARFHRRYYRLQVDGIGHLRRGPTIYAANHNGGIFGPDLTCTLGTLWEQLGADAPLYALAHDFAMRQFTPLGRALQRVGAIRAHPDNARRALEGGGSVLVYPGGDVDAYRHFRQRNRVLFGGRCGFARVAQATGVPIVPIVAHGAHRSAVIVHDGEAFARWVRLRSWARVSRFPIALSLPWGVAMGPWTPYLPLPFRIRLTALPPRYVPEDACPRAAAAVVEREMQAELDRLAATAQR